MSQKRPAVYDYSYSGEPSSSTQRPPKRVRHSPPTDPGHYMPHPPHPPHAQHFAGPHPHGPSPIPLNMDPHPAHPPTQPIRANSVAHAASPPMDPTPDDPTAFFIHPPFLNFPNCHLHGPEGLTYSILANNPDWFLDPRDFKSPGNDSPTAIPYPSHLEPPRGWCHGKKKELKEHGPDGFPDGQEPRLRCTMCRRTYAGVNAKSMWRRHIWEKHKIPMGNRREGADRGTVRGRHANKENKTRKGQNVNTTGQMPVPPGHGMEHYRHRPPEDEISMPPPAAPQIPQGELLGAFTAGNPFPPLPLAEPASIETPPLTPHGSESPELPGLPALAGATVPRTPRAELTTTPARAVIPESPYNPARTPMFRYSPPKLPSDQPWRFPSPSHPLFAPNLRHQTFASMVLGKDGAPLTPGSQASPATAALLSSRRTPETSAASSPFLMRSVSDTSVQRLRARATGRQLFSSASIPEALRPEGRSIYNLSRGPADTSADSSLTSESTEGSSAWSPGAEELSARRLEPAICLDDDDPFGNGVWSSFRKSGGLDRRGGGLGLNTDSPVLRSGVLLDQDSPVIRSRSLSSTGALPQSATSTSGIGLGLTGLTLAGSSQLMPPFDDSDDEDEVAILMYPSSDSEDHRRPTKRRRSN